MSQVLDEIAATKAKLVQAENDLVLISAGISQMQTQIANLQAVLAANPIPVEVLSALDDLQTTANTLATQASTASLPFAPPH